MFKAIKSLFKKTSPTLESLPWGRFFMDQGFVTWMTDHYRDYAFEGYSKNIIAHHCISSISHALANIPLCIYIDEKDVHDRKNPIYQVLNRPNRRQSYAAWMREIAMYRLIGGNSYIHANVAEARKERRIMEFENFRPDRVTIEVSSQSVPIAFQYNFEGHYYRYPIDALSLQSDVLQIKEPNPLNDIYGLSPMTAAAMSIDQHNESSRWNKTLLQNMGKPSGMVSIKASDTSAGLTDEQLQDFSTQLNQKYAGSKNPGKIFVSPVDVKWEQMGMSPTDMDWLNGKQTSARDICLAFKYPSVLLGIPGSVSYNNMAEAKLALYEECIIPMLSDICDSLSHFMQQHTGMQIDLEPDLDMVTALAPRREIARKNARDDYNAGIITANEARSEGGWEENTSPAANELLVPSQKLPLNFDSQVIEPKKELSMNQSSRRAPTALQKKRDRRRLIYGG